MLRAGELDLFRRQQSIGRSLGFLRSLLQPFAAARANCPVTLTGSHIAEGKVAQELGYSFFGKRWRNRCRSW